MAEADSEYCTDYVVVTGVSTGIGHAVVADLLANDYWVFGSVRKEEDAARLKEEFGERFVPLLFDVTDKSAIDAAAATVAEIVGDDGLAGLVNNAGIAVGGPLMHVDLAEFRRQLDVNVTGVLAVTQAFLPLLGAQDDPPFVPGRIVNISSVSGYRAYPMLGPYAASKHALEGLSVALRRELQVYGIDVAIIVPGAVDTPIWDKGQQADLESLRGTPYYAMGKKMLASAADAGREGMSPQKVAVTVREALESKKPKLRYLLTNNYWMGWLLPKLLPERFLDRAMTRQLDDDQAG